MEDRRNKHGYAGENFSEGQEYEARHADMDGGSILVDFYVGG